MGGPFVPRRGAARRRRDRGGGRDTFRNARLWDYRPLGATLDQLQRVRRYYDFVDVDTDRYLIDGEQRQVMLSARELALEQNPLATGFVNQRIIYTHGIGARWCRSTRSPTRASRGCSSATCPRCRRDGAPEITQPRIYFGERPTDYVITGARQAEFDFPTGEGEGGADPGRRRAGRARPASSSTAR